MRREDSEADLFYYDLVGREAPFTRGHSPADLFYRDLVGAEGLRARTRALPDIAHAPMRRVPLAATERDPAPEPVFKHFALVQHYWAGLDDDDFAGLKLDPSKTNVTYDADASVQAAVDAALASPGATTEIKALRFAIAKIERQAHGMQIKVSYGGNRLTTPRTDEAAVNTGVSALSGRRDVETWESVSCGKTAVMYAAFQLRFDVLAMVARNRQAADHGRERLWTTPAELQAGVIARWARRQQRGGPTRVIRAAGPRLELQGAVVLRDGRPIELGLVSKRVSGLSGPPALDRIFDFNRQRDGTWRVRFKGETWDPTALGALQTRLRPYGDRWWAQLTAADLASLSFFDLLWLMTSWSHNHATSVLLERLGFLYVNSLLWQSGLFDPAGAGGLFLARNWGPANLFEHWDINGDGRPGLLVPSQPRFTPDKTGPSRISSGLSAFMGVKFMVLLSRGWLTNPSSSVHMMSMLDRMGAHADRSPLADALTTGSHYPPVFARVFSKIGIGAPRADDFQNVSDCALLFRKSPSTIFAAACLDSHGQAPLAWLMKNVTDRL